MRTFAFALLFLVACSSDPPTPRSNIQHLVVLIQENHTFDGHFGAYCTGTTGSLPTCTTGPACCEAAPATEPSGAAPIVLNDDTMAAYDPNHLSDCELAEIDGGKMDQFVTGAPCSNPQNFAISDGAVMMPLWQLASQGALADRWFQPVAGQSSSNDMFFARAGFVFKDNSEVSMGIGGGCSLPGDVNKHTEQNIGDLIEQAHGSWAFYAEGYKAQADAFAQNQCATADPACPFAHDLYPCVYDPGDNPFAYYASTRDKSDTTRDLAQLTRDLAGGTLPQVSFVKGLGFRTEHPGYGTRLSDGITFSKSIVDAIMASPYATKTLVLLTYDEGGGYFDHVAPPASPDEHPYGTRVPTLALGPFAKVNAISHTQLEHSSIVRFIEWNWLGGEGKLGTRDGKVANLGSLLDASKTGVAVPE